MLMHFFVIPKEKTTQPALAKYLIDKIQNEYIDFHRRSCLRFEGIKRANEYIDFLEKAPWAEEILYGEIFKDIQSPVNEGKLATSKKLRLVLAIGLCEFLNISKSEIEKRMPKRLFLWCDNTQKVYAAIQLIRENEQPQFISTRISHAKTYRYNG